MQNSLITLKSFVIHFMKKNDTWCTISSFRANIGKENFDVPILDCFWDREVCGGGQGNISINDVPNIGGINRNKVWTPAGLIDRRYS